MAKQLDDKWNRNTDIYDTKVLIVHLTVYSKIYYVDEWASVYYIKQFKFQPALNLWYFNHYTLLIKYICIFIVVLLGSEKTIDINNTVNMCNVHMCKLTKLAICLWITVRL